MDKATEPILVALQKATFPLPPIAVIWIVQEELGLADPPGKVTIYRSLDVLEGREWIEDVTDSSGSPLYILTEPAEEWLDSGV